MNYIVKRPKETFTGLTEKLLENPNSFENIRDEIVAKLQRKRVHVKKSDKLQTLFKATSNDVAFDEYIEKVKNGEFINPDLYYFKTTPKFEVYSSKYKWLTTSLFVCSAKRLPYKVLLTFYKL